MAASAAIPTTRAREEPDAITLEITHDAHMYLRAKNTILEILEMRGFDVTPISTESPEEIIAMGDDLIKYYFTVFEDTSRPETSRKCRVFLGKTPAKIMNEITDHLDESHPERLISDKDEVLMVIFGSLSADAVKTVTRWSRGKRLQVDAIQIQNLLFNPLKHELVPEYEPIAVGSDEEKSILETFAIRKLRQLPVIQSSDIIARLLGLRKEQLVIVRNKGPGGINTFVRVCLDV